MIREWCSCGAAFHGRTMYQVREWRREHLHPDKPQPEPSGAESTTELNYGQTDLSEATIGFRPNP